MKTYCKKCQLKIPLELAQKECFLTKLENLVSRQKDLDPEFSDIINEHIWDMVGNKPTKKRF